MSEQPAIRLTGLTKEFGTVTAVDHVDLEIAAGEFFSMLGPSGSGKTTVLRLIAGFAQPTSGTVELFGEDVTDAAPFDSVPGAGFDTNPSAAAILPPPGRMTGTGPSLAIDPRQNNAFRAINRACSVSSSDPCPGKRIVNVLSFDAERRAIAVTRLESTPPLSSTPTGTSATSWRRTESCRRDSNSSSRAASST